ncbi:hypothetical protein EDD11_010501 [Mortierella claussenii]|nr:hypothetical protein EDD11_010501 [Mortierella claussenii]
MGIATDSSIDSDSILYSGPSSSTRSNPNAVLIPELAFLIQQHLQPRDLATASRVCRNWQEAWMPFLYYAVQYHHSHHQFSHNHWLAESTAQRHQYYHPQGHSEQHQRQHSFPQQLYQFVVVVPFLNLNKYGPFIKTLSLSNLVVTPHQLPSISSSSSCSSSATVSPSSSPPGHRSFIAAASAVASDASPIRDHLHQIQTCASLNLTQLDIFKTIMSLERLDDLLSALPTLKVFRFEVINKKLDSITMTSTGLTATTAATGATTGSNYISRGYMQQHHSHLLLKKPKRLTLEGLEQEVVRTIARRLSGGHLERLELIFAVTGTVVVSAFEELFASCGSSLKALSLTKAEICQRDSRRDWDTAYQAEVAALLASLSGTTISPPPQQQQQQQQQQQYRQHRFSPLSSSTTMSTSSSSSSISSAFSASTSSTSMSQFSDNESDQTYKSSPPVLESLSLYSCGIEDRECAWLLKYMPELRELNLHDCPRLKRSVVQSILTFTPKLESISLSSVPQLHPQGLLQLFSTTTASATATSDASSGTLKATDQVIKSGLQLKSVRLAYMRQIDDVIVNALVTQQGSTLVTFSLKWCPHVTDEGIMPIFQFCEKLEDLSLHLSKPTTNIFRELGEIGDAESSNNGDVKQAKKKLWACAQTLERLEVGGQMFVDRIRTSNEHLQPQLYHHMSPNPHHIRNGSTPQLTTGIASGFGIGAINAAGSHSSASNIIRDPYSVAHHQGYPMYHLWRYHRFSDPFRELQAQLETLPRLTHLGIPAKGIEHLIRKGFGSKVQLKSLALLNQQGRVWTPEELADLLNHMPELRKLYCEKNTILPSSLSSSSPMLARTKDAALWKRLEQVKSLLESHHVELVQSPLLSSSLCATNKWG